MTLWFRASQTNNLHSVFSGEGGLVTSGRWNHLGRKVIYCSESIALCTLEWLSHHGLSVSGFDYYRYAIDIPNPLIKKILPDDLPKEWNYTPATDITRDFAETHLFLNDNQLALTVPSVLVPEEFNLIINPAHKDFSNIMKNIRQLGKYSAPKR
jgi:RES domain-containing protein